jgi:peroxiredoxin-like protein
MEPHYFHVNISWNELRKGVMCSPEIKNASSPQGCIEVATPPQFPKGMEGIWSPEHLFTAAVASCFMTTFLAIAENSKLNFRSFTCDSKGKLENQDGKFAMTEVELFPIVTVWDKKDAELALRVMNKTERSCLITNSIKARVSMQARAEVAEAVNL